MKHERLSEKDVLVEDLTMCELKVREETHPAWDAPIISHLKITKKRLGFVINFDIPLINSCE